MQNFFLNLKKNGEKKTNKIREKERKKQMKSEKKQNIKKEENERKKKKRILQLFFFFTCYQQYCIGFTSEQKIQKKHLPRTLVIKII